LIQRREFWPSNLDRHTPRFFYFWMEVSRLLSGETKKAAKSVAPQWPPMAIWAAAGDDKITLKIKDFRGFSTCILIDKGSSARTSALF
jgi:hypothetical protein